MPRKLWYWKVEVSKVLADGGLAMCSLEARGAWWWLLMRMFADGADGVWEGSMQQLAHAVGAIGHDIGAIYAEWQEANVGDFEDLGDGRVRIISRRMRAEAAAREADRKRKNAKSDDNPPDSQSYSDSIPDQFQSNSESMSVMSCHDSDYDSSDSSSAKEKAERGDKPRARGSLKRATVNPDDHPWPIAMYVTEHGTPPPGIWYDLVKQRVTDREVWAATLEEWGQSGYRFQNVTDLVARYERNVRVIKRTDGKTESMTYAEMLRDAEKHGRTTEDYEPVPQSNGKPMWRQRAA